MRTTPCVYVHIIFSVTNKISIVKKFLCLIDFFNLLKRNFAD